MRHLLLLAALGCTACPGVKPSENPPESPLAPVEGQFGKPVMLGADVAFERDAALIRLTTDQTLELGWSAGAAESADQVALVRDGSRWTGRLENLPKNDEGTFIARLGDGEARQVFMLEWSHASALEDAESGVHSTDGLLQLAFERGDLPSGVRLGVLARPATKRGRKLVLGPYQVSATQAVHGRGVFSLPPEASGTWSRWSFATAQVLRSVDGAPFTVVPSVAHADQGLVAFTADAPASFVLSLEEVP